MYTLKGPSSIACDNCGKNMLPGALVMPTCAIEGDESVGIADSVALICTDCLDEAVYAALDLGLIYGRDIEGEPGRVGI